MKLLIVLGEGGHTTELLNLVDLLGERYRYHYILSQEDALSADQIRRPGQLHTIARPRGKATNKAAAVLRTLWATVQALGILLRVRPAAVVSTGPAIAVPVCLLAKLLRARVIFIETGSRVRSLSLTGKILYRFADLFFVQWQELLDRAPRGIYAGRLI